MNKPTDLELFAFLSVVEAQGATDQIVPSSLSIPIVLPLSKFISTFAEKYNITLDIPTLSKLAIEFYTPRAADDPYAAMRLTLWKITQSISLVEELPEDDLDEELWGKCINDLWDGDSDG